MIRVGACGSMDRCDGTPLSAFCSFCSLLAAAAVLCRLSHRPSSSQALYFVAATVQQQSHNNFVWTTSYFACVGIADICVHVLCVLRVCRCVRVCGFIGVLAPHISAFFFISFALLAAAAAVSFMSVSHRASSARDLYFVAATVQQQLHSKFVWTTSMPMLALHIYACVVCVL